MKSFKTRLELNNKQTTLANKHAGVARYAYNWAVNVCDASFKNKEKKRQEAQERNKIYKIKAGFEKDLSTAEKKIASLEARKSEHETALCDPQTHRDSAKIRTINLELKDINIELERSYSIWTELNSKLEQLLLENSQK